MSESKLKKRMAEKSYRHNFTGYSGIDVMTCNITGSNEQEKDIVKLEDAAEILDEVAKEFLDIMDIQAYIQKNGTALTDSEKIARYEEWFKKWLATQ